MSKLHRRRFLKESLLATTAVTFWPALGAENDQASSTRSKVPGANGDIRFAVVGFGGRGRDHIKEMREVKGTRMVALCDVDSEILGKELRQCENRGEIGRAHV